VGRSTLRQKADASRDPLYKGRAVSRNELEDSDSDDPFAKGFDDEDSEDDEHVEEGMIGLEINGRGESDDEDVDGDMDGDADMDSEDDDEQDTDASSAPDDYESSAGAKTDASAVRDLMKDTKAITSTLAAGAEADIAKGQAVKTQRKAFDTLLNSRIRLQKALVSTNSMAADTHKASDAPAAPIEAAESAALKLLNSLTDLRLSLEEARTGTKRKRPTFDASTPSSEMWSSIASSEKSALPHRKAVLERWSTKTRTTTVTNTKNRLNASATQTLTEVLDAQLHSSHLVTRTQIPRSCAPLQSAKPTKGSEPLPDIYDDADFYGLMLKELLEQRSATTDGAAEFVVDAPWQVAREAKTKRVVDTKASKGRRLRYTVQEKLQNFMAPEERGQWSERQRDDLFVGLFGQRGVLGEGDEVVSGDEDIDDAEEGGLMLFRS
jgi:protein AATF/BFR2